MSPAPRAERPISHVAVPEAVRGIAAGDAIEAVWRNQLGGLTFRVAAGTRRDRYVKWASHGTPEIDLAGEAARLQWIDGRAAVPAVLDCGADDDGAWLVTAAIAATSAVDPRWAAQPATAAAAIGTGLRRLHDALPVEECPFRWDIESRLGRVKERIASGEGPTEWFPEHRQLTIRRALERLGDRPPVDVPVVCHGDACAPNTLIDDDGHFVANVDFGHLGVADRWADLAVAAWSTAWNYGPGYETFVYDAYGVRADPERISYYRLLWDLA